MPSGLNELLASALCSPGRSKSGEEIRALSYIVARLFGGLGNQLFIYAMARALAVRNAVPLKLDTESGFRNDRTYGRKYLLDQFNIMDSRASAAESFLFPGVREFAGCGERPTR